MHNLETSIVNSALWAALGDAIGWISELTDLRGLERRAGAATLVTPVRWRRRVGGISGALVDFDVGSYSDDTQLRLAVSRSIRGDGAFDAEPFAKIELPVWLSYALGAGKGSKAAATNLIKRDVNWFSNFFVYDGGRSYVDAGGNGAAMRIQPHVWRWAGHEGRKYLDEIVRDSIVTHGNMRGICGAIFHADCLAYTLANGVVPGPLQWRKFVQDFMTVESAVNNDFQLSRFWLLSWEQASRTTLMNALKSVVLETTEYLDALEIIEWGQDGTYNELLKILDAFSFDRRGTGTNTALAAAALSWEMRSRSVEDVVLKAANAIGSDTDTIATMAGALSGTLSRVAPKWQLQDAKYIESEARRMAQISRGEVGATFRYPDLIGWQPPASQSDAVGLFNGALALSGFGVVESMGKMWKQGDFGWQWFRTRFGQTVLCKVRAGVSAEIGKHLMPLPNKKVQMTPRTSPIVDSTAALSSGTLPLFDEVLQHRLPQQLGVNRSEETSALRESRTIDELTELVIQSNFDPQVIGTCLLECSSSLNGIEKAVSFSAIVAKAVLARRRRIFK